MHTKTKIICTIGPAVNDLEKMIALIDAGMNVARLNFSHGTHESHQHTIDLLKETRKQSNCPMAIMLDTKGPEIRVGDIKDSPLSVKAGDQLRLTKKKLIGSNGLIPINPGHILKDLKLGTKILFNDGYISSRVSQEGEDEVTITVENSGSIKTHAGVNIPNTSLDLPAMTEQDVQDIKFACRNELDIVAASFIRNAEHVMAIKRLLASEGKYNTLVIAKIENSEGITNFDSILQVSDGIMIARGDLGVEVPLSQVPSLQKMMIRRCYQAGKPSVIATQMLESMINNPRPTRAEVSDVANAIYDSTTTVMLSGETAVGKYPIEAVRVMKSVIRETEADFDYTEFFARNSKLVFYDVPSAVTLSSVKTAYSSNAKAIFAFTNSGSTARLISRLRPNLPIIAMTPKEKNYHQLAFNWGVIPFFNPNCTGSRQAIEDTGRFALSKNIVQYGDLVVVTAGSPFGVSGTTNMMLVESIGDVLIRGFQGVGKRTYGKVSVVLAPNHNETYQAKDRLLVITKCDDSYLPLIKEAKGIILQNHIDDASSEKYATLVAKTLDIPLLLRADSACTILKEGQLVTLDPKRALVYHGAVVDQDE